MSGSLGWNVDMKIAKTFSLMFEASDWCVQIAHCFRFPFQMPPFVVACHAKHVEDAENVNASVTRTAPTCVHLLFHVRGECCAPTPDASRRGGLSRNFAISSKSLDGISQKSQKNLKRHTTSKSQEGPRSTTRAELFYELQRRALRVIFVTVTCRPALWSS